MSFGLGPETTSSASDNRVAATDNAQVVGKSGILVNPGSVNTKGDYGYNVKGNKGPVVFQSLDQQVVADALDKLGKLGAGYTDSIQKLTDSTAQQTNDLVGNVINELNTLATSAQTGGQAPRDTKIIILALGALAVLGLVLVQK